MNIVPFLLISSFLYFSIILTIPASIFGKEISKDFDTTIEQADKLISPADNIMDMLGC